MHTRRMGAITGAVAGLGLALIGCHSGGGVVVDPPPPGGGDPVMSLANDVLDGAPVVIDSAKGVKRFALGDFDSTNGLDIAVADEEKDDEAGVGVIRVYLNNGSGVFGAPVQTIRLAGRKPVAIMAREMDCVGASNPLDLVVACAPVTGASGTLEVFRGLANGTFTDPCATPAALTGVPACMTVASLDGPTTVGGDTRRTPDVVVALQGGVLACFRNNGNAVLAPESPGANGPPRPNSIGSGDLDNDKDVDPEIVVDGQDGAGTGVVMVFTNHLRTKPWMFKLAQTVTYDKGATPGEILLHNLCGDGFLDVATVDSSTGRVTVLENRGGVWDWWAGLSNSLVIAHPGSGAAASEPLGGALGARGKPGWLSTYLLTLTGDASTGVVTALEKPWPDRADLKVRQVSAPIAAPGKQMVFADVTGDGVPDAVTAGGYLKGLP